MKFAWSEEVTFVASSIKENVPACPGVYQILQSAEYPRYDGSTRVLKIGISKSNLREELLNHIIRHHAANRLSRMLNHSQVSVTIRFTLVASEKTADAEKELLREFEDRHWDLPVLNSNRGYQRGEDSHFRHPAGRIGD
jgi:hypothetical protein